MPPADHRQTLQEIRDLFAEAEQVIKEVEDFGGELVVPAANQLRYTGNHLIRYLADPDCAAAEEELSDAIKHCKRATYDAYEAAILYQLMEFQKFKDDYRNTIVTDVIPSYSDILAQVAEARDFARKNNQSKTRGESYQAGREHLEVITRNVSKLNAAREELNKKIKKDRLHFFVGAIGALSGLVLLIIGLASYLFS
ncbi:hypothetical protein [Desulfurivibrio dismutans]|uniref:hypothetical protein n=1 Tax=Desulfurivibrio dismutans TaxID=1398908 RepID=UPI0023DC2F1B|nr:hypothetical protein [Desulfurivibrio alkaliphilus]MDF1615250.1 hypothetical protein [Desulfurivibrio alkaliphilus]